MECLDRLYLNGYIGQAGDIGRVGDVHARATGQADSVAGGAGAGDGEIPRSGEGDGGAGTDSALPVRPQGAEGRCRQRFRRQRGVRDGIVFIGVAQEKAQAFQGKKIDGQFEFTRDKTVYVNHYYFYIDDADFGPLFLKVCSYAPWGTKLCLNGHEWAKRQLENEGDRLRSPGQRLPVVRRAGEVAADLRLAGAGGHRSGVPQMAEADSAAVAAARSGGRLRLGVCRSGRWK